MNRIGLVAGKGQLGLCNGSLGRVHDSAREAAEISLGERRRNKGRRNNKESQHHTDTLSFRSEYLGGISRAMLAYKIRSEVQLIEACSADYL